jgi:hypothetical protein
MTTPPLIDRLRPKSPIVRLGVICGALIIALCISVLAGISFHRSAIAEHDSAKAATQARDVALCVSNLLADRSGASAKDDAANQEFVNALEAVVGAPSGQQAALLHAAVTKYNTVIDADKSYRDAHPFTNCSILKGSN